MVKNYSLIFVAFLCFVLNGFGQILTFEFSALSGNEGSANSNFNDINLATSTITRGIGLSSGNNIGRFNATDWTTSATLDLTDYMEFTIVSNVGFQFSVSSIYIQLERSETGPKAIALRSSLDGYATNLDTSYNITDGTNTQEFTFNFTQPSSSTAVTYRVYMYNAEATTGTGGIGDDAGNDIVVTGVVSTTCTDAPDFVNVQFPTSPAPINDGDVLEVYAQAYEPSLTETTGQAVSLLAWIGFNTVNNEPSLTGWTWIPATFNTQVGNNDEFMAEIGSALTPGTYYYASRFQLNGCGYVYGGTGGIWNNNSVELIVTADQVNFCNVDFPKTATIDQGIGHDVYAQVYEPGVTDAGGQGANIEAWIGYTTNGIDYEPSQTTGWTWMPAAYDSDFGNNDQYVAEIGSSLPAGTYYYASRFRLNGSSYSYGGIQTNNVGNFWNLATFNNGVLTVNTPPLADVVITEIMYNTTETDDEWIEICNVSGSTQNLSGYRITVNGNDEFTFPIGTFIVDATCITVSLGSNGVGDYNTDCPFISDYGIGATTNSTNNLPNDPNNSGVDIKLQAPDNSVADHVSYDDADGGDNTDPDSSLHVIDISSNNSNTSNNWTTVTDGGSHGINSIVSQCSPNEPEINVEGDLASYPNIPNNDTTPSGTDNTLFAAQFIGSSQEKGFRIQNLGLQNLTITSITIVGTNPGDFTISILPETTISSGGLTTFEVSFSPLAAGTRTAIVEIISNDTDENPYTFQIEGDGDCVANAITLYPSSGPENTIVTVMGNNLTGATAFFNGIPATITTISDTEMEVTVPAIAVTGNLEIIDGSGCPGAAPFEVINQKISDCEGSATLTKLFISQVTDSPSGSLTYIELYNATGAAINFVTTNYRLQTFNNGQSTATGGVTINNGSIPQNSTFVVALSADTDPECDIVGGDGDLANLQDNNSFISINYETNKNDYVGLYDNSNTLIDAFGVYVNDTWANGLGLGNAGANFERRTDVTLPNTTFSVSDWNITDWINCDDTNYEDSVGVYDFSLSDPPSVTLLEAPISGCDLTAQLMVLGTQGHAGGNLLAYQWFYNEPGTANWIEILPSDTAYSGQQSDTLNILNTLSLHNYQYYCQVRENTDTCYIASNAINLTVDATVWNDSTWTNGPPNLNSIAVIDDDYDTSTDGSFSACQLVLNDNSLLNVANGTYVEVQNYAIINGDILVETHGAFVQRADLTDGFILNSGGTASVNKLTAEVHNWYDYTYWSSPVVGATVGTAIDIAPANRRFFYEAANYLDVTMEANNDDATVLGHDDIDDNGDDWQIASAEMVMAPGQGFAATVTNSGPFPGTRQITFTGSYNTGTLTTPIFWNGDNGDNDWNLIGNPYPSAISFNDLYNTNSTLVDGAAYLWSQASAPSDVNNGNENQNFNMADYAIITIGSGNTAGGDEIVPNGFIPSGQSFFIKVFANGNLTFTNDMRMADATSNNQFFRTIETYNRLWLNLTSDNGVFNQVLVAYVDGATSADDGMAYDAQRNLSSGVASILYSIVPNSDKKFAIQGKNPNSLTLDEVVPLGFYTSINEATIYNLSIAQFEGEFFANQTVYVKDNLLNVIHDLSTSDYVFTSEVGTFDTRFEIVFNEQALSVTDPEIPSSDLTIIELANGQVKFTVGHNLTIQAVEIFDMLGRSLYNLSGSNGVELYNLSGLSQAAYIAKVTLSNGQTITKRAVKRH